MADTEMEIDPVKKKSSRALWVALSAVLAAVVFGGGGYYVGTRSKSEKLTATPTTTTSVTITQSPTATADSESAKVSEFIKAFELLNEKQDPQEAAKMLDLFSAPQSEKDKEALSFLKGEDLNPASPRIHATATFSYQISEYQILEKTKTENGYKVTVSETRRGWDNTTGQWGAPKTSNRYFDLTQNAQEEYRIDKYYSDSDNSKYGGFY